MTRRTFCIPHLSRPDLYSAPVLPTEGYVLVNYGVWKIEHVDVHAQESWYTLTAVNTHHLPVNAKVVELPRPTGELQNASRSNTA